MVSLAVMGFVSEAKNCLIHPKALQGENLSIAREVAENCESQQF